jgi:hypothetical protein
MLQESIAIRVSRVLDKYLPADGPGTEREILRINLHHGFTMLLIEEQDKHVQALIKLGKSIFNLEAK